MIAVDHPPLAGPHGAVSRRALGAAVRSIDEVRRERSHASWAAARRTLNVPAVWSHADATELLLTRIGGFGSTERVLAGRVAARTIGHAAHQRRARVRPSRRRR